MTPRNKRFMQIGQRWPVFADAGHITPVPNEKLAHFTLDQSSTYSVAPSVSLFWKETCPVAPFSSGCALAAGYRVSPASPAATVLCHVPLS
mmetsp:Transcript_5209/g.10074  ORF Transcript_5209/g.10074 Transcript_5209/m.10074 type:complete len:91 (-) Transcript_5209:111-383(-)